MCQGYKWLARPNRPWMWKTWFGRQWEAERFLLFVYFFSLNRFFPKAWKPTAQQTAYLPCAQRRADFGSQKEASRRMFSSYCHPQLSQPHHSHHWASWINQYSIRSDNNDFNFYFAVEALFLLKITSSPPTHAQSSCTRLLPHGHACRNSSVLLCSPTLHQISGITAWSERKERDSVQLNEMPTLGCIALRK